MDNLYGLLNISGLVKSLSFILSFHDFLINVSALLHSFYAYVEIAFDYTQFDRILEEKRNPYISPLTFYKFANKYRIFRKIDTQSKYMSLWFALLYCSLLFGMIKDVEFQSVQCRLRNIEFSKLIWFLTVLILVLNVLFTLVWGELEISPCFKVFHVFEIYLAQIPTNQS